MPTYDDAPDSLIELWERRRGRLLLGPGQEFDPDVDLAALATTPVGPDLWPDSTAGNAVKARALRAELVDGTELHLLNALLISHLRKRRCPKPVKALFRRIWIEQGDRLCRELSSRWLISSVISFGDFGATESERRVGLAFNVFFSLMKLYEFERLLTGYASDEPGAKRARGDLPLDMSHFSIRGGGLDINLLAPLWLTASQDPVAGPIALELLERLNDDTRGVFARIQSMRAAALEAET